MTARKIEKRSDPAVRHLRNVRDGEDRERVFCEGFRLVEELLKSGWPVQEAYATPETEERARSLLQQHGSPSAPLRVVSESVMTFVSSLETPPGLIAIAKKRRTPSMSSATPLILVLHGLQLPQNVGAVLRSAEAAGVAEVWTTRSTSDPFNPKALRGSSGSAFRLPIFAYTSLTDVARDLKTRGVLLVAAHQDGAVPYDRVDWCGPTALAVGSEGAGFAGSDASLFDLTIRIPMAGAVESLNVANAASVCLFEAARQRRARIEKGNS